MDPSNKASSNWVERSSVTEKIKDSNNNRIDMPMSLKSKTSIAMKTALKTLGKVKWKILTSPERKRDR